MMSAIPMTVVARRSCWKRNRSATSTPRMTAIPSSMSSSCDVKSVIRTAATTAVRTLFWSVAGRGMSLAGLPGLLAEESLRPEDHDQDEVDEDDRRRPRAADPVVGDLLDDPDDEAAEHGALEVPDAAEHGGGEGDQAGLEALEVPDRGLVERIHESRGTGHEPAQQERERDRGVHVDAHQTRRLGILGGCAHGAAHPAPRDEPGEQDHERDRHPDGQHVALVDVHAADSEEDLL